MSENEVFAPIVLDMAKMVENDKPAPIATYHVCVKSFELNVKTQEEYNKLKSEGKYPAFKASGEILSGPLAGRRLYVNLTTNPEETANGGQKCYMLYNFLKVCGFEKHELSAFTANEENLNRILNYEMYWVVDKDTRSEADEDATQVKSFKKVAA